jgi:hypothetical protein
MQIRHNGEPGSQFMIRSFVGQHWEYPLSTHVYTTPVPKNDTTAQICHPLPRTLSLPARDTEASRKYPNPFIGSGPLQAAPDSYQRVATKNGANQSSSSRYIPAAAKAAAR